MVDDESGQTFYSDHMVERWDGLWVHRDNNESRHPQWFVKARNDPRALMNVRPDIDQALVDNTFDLDVGETSVPTMLDGAATHLFQPGIDKMVIEDPNPLIVFEVS